MHRIWVEEQAWPGPAQKEGLEYIPTLRDKVTDWVKVNMSRGSQGSKPLTPRSSVGHRHRVLPGGTWTDLQSRLTVQLHCLRGLWELGGGNSAGNPLESMDTRLAS